MAWNFILLEIHFADQSLAVVNKYSVTTLVLWRRLRDVQ